MKKAITILLSLILFVVIILLSFYLATRVKEEVLEEDWQKKELLSQEMTAEEKNSLNLQSELEYEILSRDSEGNIDGYRIKSMPENILAEIDWMTDEEKEERSLSKKNRYQVLERNKSGDILAYKVINSDDDIVLEYKHYNYSE
ncbi:MAG: hypothetical protein PHE99_06320 [Bacteroidales bacterium]|nr:hypothetical protein [Bacteroidales bacterium]